MVFKTALESYRSPTFIGQVILTMAINFGINFGLEWATLSKWGDRSNTEAWPDLEMWVLNTDVNSCLGMDVLLTSFLIAFFCTLLATGGTQKEVREKKCDVLDPEATAAGLWRYTPVRFRGLCARSCAMGFFFLALCGLPTVLLLWAAVGSSPGAWSGYAYTVFKGCWASAMSALVYALLFPAAIDKRNFPELEFEELMELQAAAWKDEAPPQVAAVGLV
jgi:hypothetical protein